MSYQKTLDFLYSKLPMFTRIGAVAIKKDLHNTLALCSALNHPQNQFKSIHIGGTNGKGSTSHMLAAILQEAGFKTGLYTSPHLKDFRERIRVNGKMVPKAFVTSFVEQHKKSIATIEPSFFEVTVAMAFDYFAKEKVDFAVIEVGLGGRLDSTNVITPEVSVITNISLDHTQILGDTLAAIAFEKAGIIKHKVPVVIGEHQPEPAAVFLEKAQLENAPISFANRSLNAKSTIKNNLLIVDVFKNEQLILPELTLDLTGKYQLKNVLTVLECVFKLQEKGFSIPTSSIYSGLRNVKKITGLQGRWQTLQQDPLVICDTGHNKAGITEVLENIDLTEFDQLHMVMGMVKDKDVDGVLALLPTHATYYFCAPDLERALPEITLQMQAKHFNLKGQAYPTVLKALEAAKMSANPKDLVFVGGSTFVVAEIL